ncbi:MAG: hypothetical protein ACI9YT_000589 [Halobacteriales archaeon]|jgi:hypothetical protein
MAFPDLAVNAIYTVLCLVPGFVSLQTATYAGGVDPDLTEFEKSTWSFIASGVSLSVAYFLYVIWMAVATGQYEIIRSLDIAWVDIVAVYPVLLVVAVLVGYLSAMVYARALGTPAAAQPEGTQ